MSNSESRPTGGRLAEAAPDYCAARQLEGTLQSIADHLLDLDRRQSEALAEMQVRLAGLGARAEAMQSEVPDEFAEAFGRIQDGVELLAARLSATERRPVADTAPPDAAAIPAPTPAVTVAAVMAAPAALRSAMPAAPDRGRASPAVDPFDFQDEPMAPGDRSNPWDRASAEALVNHYDPAPATLPPPARAVAPVAPEPVFAAAMEPVDSDRAWFEARFADIAARVEQSLADIRPESSFVALGERFDLFDERLGNALQDVATRADVEGLRLVEAHITELTSQVEHAQIQLSRLEVIESQLARLMEQLSDERLAQGGAMQGGAGISATDMQQIADMAAQLAAEQTAGRVEQLATQLAVPSHPQAIDPADGGAHLAQLHEMLQAYADERRQGEATTASTLDTVQQALLRVLDRVESIEQTQLRALAARSATPEARFDIDPRQQGFATLEAGQSRADNGRPAGAVAAATAAAARLGAASGRSGMVRPAVVEPTTPAADRHREPAAAPSRRPVDAQPQQPQQSPLRRDDFMAAARRQVQQAGGQTPPRSTAADAQESTPKSTGGLLARLTGRDKAKSVAESDTGRKFTDGEDDGKGGPLGSKAYLLVAMLALIVAGGLFLMVRPTQGPIAPASAERKVSPTAQTENKASPPVPAKGDAATPATPAAESASQGSAAPPAATPAPPPGFEQKAQSPAPVATPPPLPRPSPKASEAPAPASRSAELDTGGTTIDAQPALAAVSLGIALAERTQAATPQEIVRVRQQQQMADISGRIAAQSARVQAQAAATPTAAVATGSLGDMAPQSISIPAPPPASAVTPAGQAVSAADMPPALIGPTSLRLAAAKGDPSAEFEVASRFAQGKGVKQDFDEAARWYQRAAARGFGPAQYRVGTLYERGLGVKADLARARVWYQRAAEQGNVRAMHNLAVLSAGRQASSPDYATASHWFTEAAEYGLADSQFNLAVLLENGLGVTKDPIEATKWFTLAARGGDKEALRRLELIKRTLDVAALRDAEAALAQWQARPVDKLVNDALAAGEAWKGRAAAAAPAN